MNHLANERILCARQRLISVGQRDLVEHAASGDEVGFDAGLVVRIIKPERTNNLNLGLRIRAPGLGRRPLCEDLSLGWGDRCSVKNSHCRRVEHLP